MKHNDHTNHHEHMAEDFQQRFIITALISIPILILSPTIQAWLGFSLPGFPGEKFLLAGLAAIIALWGAKPFYTHALAELRDKQLGMMVLVSLAVGTGFLYSLATTFFIEAPDFYWEISTLTVVLLFGHWMEMRAVVGTSGALKELVKLIPPKANKLVAGEIQEVTTEQLGLGDSILIRPGEKVPVDAKVTEGTSSVNEALLTGESKPVSKTVGDELIGGSINIDSSLQGEVAKVGKDTALAQIIELVRSAQSSKPKTQKLADRAAHYLTLTAIIVGVLTFLSWNFFLGASFVFALTLTITVIVITCPHALGLAIPTVVTITSSLAARNGILIKNMDGLEQARGVDWIIFDKTGTLTKGEFGLSEIIAAQDSDDLLFLAASLEQHSEHVIAQSIVTEARKKKINLSEVKNFAAFPGMGVLGNVANKLVIVGTEKLMDEHKVKLSQDWRERARRLEEEAKTVVNVAIDGKMSGIIGLSDIIKTESKPAIQKLKALGFRVAMLTGDNRQAAEFVARELSLDHVFAEVLPEDKIKAVKKLQNDGKKVMMVGDGVNDAPALTQADVGVAIGAGTDVAVESAEIVLVKNNPLDIVKLVKLSQETVVKMKQNLAWATGYNIVAIPLAAGVLAGFGVVLRPEWGALAMSISSVIVVANALRLRTTRLV